MRAFPPLSRRKPIPWALCPALLVCLLGCGSKVSTAGTYGGRRSHERSIEPAEPPREATADSTGRASAAVDGSEAAPMALAQTAQAEAIEACESAEVFLDEGELDDAIAALDRAYELMLNLPENGDPVAAQTKADIRRIVAEKLLDIYASQRTAAGEPRIEWDLEIQIVENDRVQQEIKSFQKAEGGFLIGAYRRSGRYRPMILAKLAEAGLPSQLSWLPLIESGFKVDAYSRAKALGMWQFILSTGRRYGLSRDAWIDERMDPERSTDAAIAYLSELHDLFGDWPQALAAYNCGEHRVLRLDRQEPGQDLDFWDLYEQLPRETRRYVPRFFATLAIIEDPGRFGIELPEPLEPLSDPMVVTTEKEFELKGIESRLGLPEGLLRRYNPELRRGITPKATYELKVPAERHASVRECLREMPVYTPPTPKFVTHRVRRGQNLSTIASIYGVGVNAIARANGIRNVNRIYPGRRIKIPVAAGYSPSFASQGVSADPVVHVVRRGDTLWDIAKRYGTSVNTIKRENRLSSSRITPGTKLRIVPGSRHGARVHTVRKGDTLGKIARKYGVDLGALMRANGLTSRSTIYPDQRIVVP
ncbi:MAG: lytic transglycosylase [Gemmatimonadetes bacterium]|nr:lytic transglycosylase [Gemmatimonadota bacterium]